MIGGPAIAVEIADELRRLRILGRKPERTDVTQRLDRRDPRARPIHSPREGRAARRIAVVGVGHAIGRQGRCPADDTIRDGRVGTMPPDLDKTRKARRSRDVIGKGIGAAKTSGAPDFHGGDALGHGPQGAPCTIGDTVRALLSVEDDLAGGRTRPDAEGPNAGDHAVAEFAGPTIVNPVAATVRHRCQVPAEGHVSRSALERGVDRSNPVPPGDFPAVRGRDLANAQKGLDAARPGTRAPTRSTGWRRSRSGNLAAGHQLRSVQHEAVCRKAGCAIGRSTTPTRLLVLARGRRCRARNALNG